MIDHYSPTHPEDIAISESELHQDTAPLILPKKKRRPWKQILGTGIVVSIAALAVYTTQYALPQTQQLDSQAASAKTSAWVKFMPPRKIAVKNTSTTTRLTIQRRGSGSISLVKVEIAYDATKISNLSAIPLDWVPNQQPIVLQPFTIHQNGASSRATITLGAPCDAKQCYPAKKLNLPLLILTYTPAANTTLAPTSNSIILFTGKDDNQYNHAQSRDLNITIK